MRHSSMKKNLRLITGGLAALAALALSSCAYDPYYGGSSASYSSYGHGYGYGGSSFSTSIFVSTGDPRWGYDPYCRSYYDYRRRAYYDPYLYGYYPIGYRPPVIIGVPHPYGWRPGSHYCPPPSRVTNVTLVNYRDRESAYRNSNHSWARQVRQQPTVAPRNSNQRDDNRSGLDRGNPNSRDPRSGRTEAPGLNRVSGNDRSTVQDRRQPRAPSTYNTPVEIRPSQPSRPSPQPSFGRTDERWNPGGSGNVQSPSPRSSGYERQAPAPSQRGEERSSQRPERSGNENRDRGGDRGGNRDEDREGRVRGLGQG